MTSFFFDIPVFCYDFFVLFLSLGLGMCPRLTLNSLCSPSWSQSHGNPCLSLLSLWLQACYSASERTFSISSCLLYQFHRDCIVLHYIRLKSSSLLHTSKCAKVRKSWCPSHFMTKSASFWSPLLKELQYFASMHEVLGSVPITRGRWVKEYAQDLDANRLTCYQ